jgi:hypothetical protein
VPVRLEPSCHRSAKYLAILPRVFQAGAHAFPQDFPFELCEYGKERGHGAVSRRRQIPHRRIVVVHHFSLRRLALQLLQGGLEDDRCFRYDLALRRNR